MTVPNWTDEQKRGCGAAVIVAVVVGLLLPLAVVLWKLALGWR